MLCGDFVFDDVGVGEGQSLHHHEILVGQKRLRLQLFVSLLNSFRHIPDHQPLIEAFDRAERRLIAEEQMQKVEARNILADNNEAERKE